MLSVRPVCDADIALLWRWANDPLVRASAFDSAPIEWAQHLSWFTTKAQDPLCLRYIIEDDHRAVGQVRFDQTDGKLAEVDVSVAPEARGRRYAVRMLLLACAALFHTTDVERVRADIKTTNTASITAFRAAGFQISGRGRRREHDVVTMTLSRFSRRGVAVFHADGGRGIGLGHAARCVGLASVVAARGLHPLFLVDPLSGLDRFVANYGFDRRHGAASVQDLGDACQDVRAAALIVDSYRLSPAELAVLADRVPVLVAFDDGGRCLSPTDIVIDGSPAASQHAGTSDGTPRYLRGAQFQVVRPEFIDVPTRRYARDVARILVTAGGDDPLGVLGVLREFFERRPGLAPGAAVDIVVGPFAATLDATTGSRVRVISRPDDMRQLMLEADVAVSGGGQTLYELFRCGTPVVAVCVGADQERQLRALEALNVFHYIGWANAAGWLSRLEDVLAKLDRDASMRERAGRAAARLIDGQGASRIVDQMHEVVAASMARSRSGGHA